MTYDSGNYEPALARALEMVGYDELRADAGGAARAGEANHLGIGISSYVEMCGLAPSRLLGQLNFGAGGWEHATVRFLPTGKVEVVTGTSPHGQGHETSWSMIAADCLGVPPEDVEVLHSDTAISHLGLDTYGSRSLSVGGMALAQRVRQGRREGARDRGARVGGGGRRPRVRRRASSGSWARRHGRSRSRRLRSTRSPRTTCPRGWSRTSRPTRRTTRRTSRSRSACTSRWSRSTRRPASSTSSATSPSTTAATQINPLIVEGQIHGGIVQGIAQALWEEAVYDDSGNLRTASLTDYLVPSAAEAPHMELDSTVTPSPTTALGVKGIGEAGTIGATPAVMNAVIDALVPLGITNIDMPASPERVWAAITEASR